MAAEPVSTPLTGLTATQVAEQRARGLGNVALPPTGRTYGQIIRENVFTFINVVIFILAAALVLVGRAGDAVVSLGVISLNILVSVVQEIRAKRTLDHIALLTRPSATVIRDGQEQQISPDDLVIGDLVKIGPGDQIVLDGQVAGDGKMQVDESQLTGESNLVPKQVGDPMYSGSFCVNGTGLYVVQKVGTDSLANQITAGARAFRRVLTPLQNEVYLVVRVMLVIVVYLEFLLVVNAFIKDIAAAESIADATLVVGLVPNGLFVSISIAYALGAVRIIRFGALVQQSNAIESLSNVDVLCLDKTGTLTANRLQVHAVHPLNGLAAEELQRGLGTMVVSAAAMNKTAEAVAKAYPQSKRLVVADVPFSSARKWSAVALDAEDMRGIYAMGAPEMLRPYLGAASDIESDTWQLITQLSRELTDQGLRVLLVAWHADPLLLKDEGDASQLPGDMQPIGLVSLSDELRPEAKETLSAFIRSGVQPKIISGDNPETVYALAKQAGLGEGVNLISGLELEQLSNDQFDAAATASTIFGRITPQQKEKLVDALKRRGHYVAMIGDGVNDVLSLKKADLGISMQSGSQATRAVADIVLMKDSFAALAPAVQEGQRIANGMQDVLKLFLTRILTMALLILSSMVVGVFPLALRHGSLVTLFAVGIPAVMLAVWARPGPSPKGTMVQRLANFIMTPVLFTSAIGLLLFYAVLLLPATVQGLTPAQIVDILERGLPIAQTALSAFLVVTGLLLVMFVEPPTDWLAGADVKSGDWKPTLLTAVLLIGSAIIFAVPLFRNLFSLSTLGPLEVGLVSLATIIWFFVTRFFWRRRIFMRFLNIKAV